MYFIKLNFGEALACLEAINNNFLTLSESYFASPVIGQLKELQDRVSSETISIETGSYTDADMEGLLEECFIQQIFRKNDQISCDSFYKAVTSSFTLFEKFCAMHKDYLNFMLHLNNTGKK